MPNDTLTTIKNSLRKWKNIGSNQWEALCPAHNDTDPSLHIKLVDDGRILLHCKAGCNINNICSVIGITTKDLSPRKKSAGSSSDGDPNVYYDYRDIDGSLLYQVIRKPDKNFPQRRPGDNGEWIYKMKGTKYVPYRLPDIIGKDLIVIVEGEKDADRLHSIGITATTSPMGAGNWKDDYCQYLKGSSVVVIPDNDDLGLKHALQVVQSLQKNKMKVKFLDLPGLEEKGDVSDWLDSGGTKDNLLQLIEETPFYGQKNRKAQVVLLSEVEPEEIEWLWEPYIPKRKLTILEGDPDHGKTFLALNLSAIISRGWPFPSSDGTPGSSSNQQMVLYMTCEDGIADTIRPRLDSFNADCNMIAHTRLWKDEDKEGYITLQDLDVMDNALNQVKPALLVIDPLVGFLGDGVDMNKANDVRPVLAGIIDLAEKHNVAVLGVRHLTKGTQTKSLYRGIGSVDFTAHARSVLLVGADPNNDQKKVLVHIKSNLAPKGPSLGYELSLERGFLWTGVSNLSAHDLLEGERDKGEKSAMEEALAFIEDMLELGPCEATKIKVEAKKLSISETTLNKAKAELGVKSSKLGIKNGPWVWSYDR